MKELIDCGVWALFIDLWNRVVLQCFSMATCVDLNLFWIWFRYCTSSQAHGAADQYHCSPVAPVHESIRSIWFPAFEGGSKSLGRRLLRHTCVGHSASKKGHPMILQSRPETHPQLHFIQSHSVVTFFCNCEAFLFWESWPWMAMAFCFGTVPSICLVKSHEIP